MKKVIITAVIILLTGTVLNSFAQQKEGPATWLKTGSVLSYHLMAQNEGYDYIVSDLIMKNSISFKWKMTSPINYTGSVQLSDMAIDTASSMIANFENGSSLNLQDKTTVWLSRKLYKTLKSQAPAKITIENSSEIFNYVRNESYPVKIDGTVQKLDVILAQSPAGNKLWILDYPQYPLIIQMQLDFTLYLQSVEVAK
ncbi:MAG TPA: hypothetical protein PKI01_10210 [Bacteroidales bacterium]|nr:hypothetical protein [Bacteroidales bacterium]